MDTIEKILKKVLFRHLCPTPIELGEYELGLLDAPRHEQIHSHIGHCVHCRQDLVRMLKFMAMPLVQKNGRGNLTAETPSLAERAKIFVVNLLSPPPNILVSPTLEPAWRGEKDDMQTQVYHIGSYLVALSYQRDPTRLNKHYLLGDISLVDEDTVTFEEWQAHLWRANRLLATIALDIDGHFNFIGSTIDDAVYELILSGPEAEIHLENLLVP